VSLLTGTLLCVFACGYVVSVTGKKGVGIPVILLHDAEGGIVTVEMKDGCIYRGTLEDAQDNMNLTLTVLASTCFSPLNH
jgi:hypothetical protein